jgi:hypothetical protein
MARHYSTREFFRQMPNALLARENWLRSEATGGTSPGSGRRTLRYRIHPAIKGKRKGGDI